MKRLPDEVRYVPVYHLLDMPSHTLIWQHLSKESLARHYRLKILTLNLKLRKHCNGMGFVQIPGINTIHFYPDSERYLTTRSFLINTASEQYKNLLQEQQHFLQTGELVFEDKLRARFPFLGEVVVG